MGKLKYLLYVIGAIIAFAPIVMFFGMKLSPLAWGLLGPINESNGLALQGYDPVAYFNEGRAIKGDTNKGLRWRDTIWYFSSDVNKLTFKTFPEKFIPQFGGYCATAVATGFTADINPEVWHIENDKLYLFFDAGSKNEFVANIDPSLSNTGKSIIEKSEAEWAKRK